MDEQEKRELIRAINEIREEIRLQPYPFEQLEAKDLEELRKLYSSHFQMREDYKRLKEKPRFKLSLKIGLLIIAMLVLVILFLTLIPFKGALPLSTPTPSEIRKQEVLNFTVWFATYKDNQSTFILQNKGTNISAFMLKLDGKEVEPSIISGKLPLSLNEEIHFSIKDFYCDDQLHDLTVIIDNKTQEIKFANLCIVYG